MFVKDFIISIQTQNWLACTLHKWIRAWLSACYFEFWCIFWMFMVCESYQSISTHLLVQETVENRHNKALKKTNEKEKVSANCRKYSSDQTSSNIINLPLFLSLSSHIECFETKNDMLLTQFPQAHILMHNHGCISVCCEAAGSDINPSGVS